MSHFAKYDCKISDKDYVKRALVEMGHAYRENVEIIDWAKQKRHVSLAVVHNGEMLPLGIMENKETKELDLVADWFMTPFREKEFTSELSQLHAKYNVEDSCKQNGWDIVDTEVNEEGELVMTASYYG